MLGAMNIPSTSRLRATSPSRLNLIAFVLATVAATALLVAAGLDEAASAAAACEPSCSVPAGSR